MPEQSSGLVDRPTLRSVVKRGLDALTRYTMAPPSLAGSIASKASAASDAGDDSVALRYWDQLIELQPSLAPGYAGRAGALRRLGRRDEAESAIRDGLGRFPDDLTILFEQ